MSHPDLPRHWRVAAIINGFKDTFAYKSEFILEFFASAIVPAAIQLLLWYALFKNGNNPHIAGQSYADLVAYTWVSVLFSQVRGGNYDFDLAEMIRNGSLSQYLLRPVGAVEFVYFRGLSYKLLIAIMCLCLGVIASSFTSITIPRMFGAMFLALLGNVIAYQLGAALAAVAFKWEEAYSVLMVKNLVVQFLSGELVPLYFFPENYSWIWKIFPFHLYVYGPTQFALGKMSAEEFLMNCTQGIGWVLFCWALVHFTWSRGIKNYSSIGG